MAQASLETIVQRMIDAGESEENIATVIKAQRQPIEPGNIELRGRPKIANPNGGTSTVYSTSVNIDGREVLLPLADEGRILSEDEAVAKFKRTGKHLGIFATPEAATAYASKLHDEYASGKYDAPIQQRSRTGQMYTPPSDSGPIGEFGSHLAAGLNPVNVIGGGARLLGNVLTDPKEAGRQVVEGIAAPFREAAKGNLAGAAGDVAAMVAMPSIYRNVGGGVVAATGEALKHPLTREAAAAAVRHGSTVAGAHVGGGGGAVIGATIGEQLAARLRKPIKVVGDTVDAVPAGVETAQQQLQRMSRERWLRGPESAQEPSSPAVAPTQVKSIVEAAQEVQQAVKESKIKVSAQEYLAATKLIAEKGVSADDALAAVKRARGLPSDAEVAAVVAAKNARTAK